MDWQLIGLWATTMIVATAPYAICYIQDKRLQSKDKRS